ncbi:hypothetical protein SI65_10054 [Aspergillus cristatus]|uniref:Myb-like domain-containing protein n=1 Tax=Aspergillus cristatus TaxID=573508 RepID=A0A1E3B0W6_ASPCR|nr:hypothetical protein SI65_10054 [Aspergillus cristatus]
MSFMALNGDGMELPFAKQGPGLNEIAMTPEFPAEVKEEDANERSIPTPTLTPRKRARGKKATADEDNTDEQDLESPSKKNKTKSPAKRPGGLGPIPANYEEASEADQLLIRLKDENKPWNEITRTLEDITGTKLIASGLRSRYARIKANLVVFEKSDEPILLRIKKDIEHKQELEKWQRVADGIESTSGNKYPISTIQKKFKELCKISSGNGFAVTDEE